MILDKNTQQHDEKQHYEKRKTMLSGCPLKSTCKWTSTEAAFPWHHILPREATVLNTMPVNAKLCSRLLETESISHENHTCDSHCYGLIQDWLVSCSTPVPLWWNRHNECSYLLCCWLARSGHFPFACDGGWCLFVQRYVSLCYFQALLQSRLTWKHWKGVDLQRPFRDGTQMIRDLIGWR